MLKKIGIRKITVTSCALLIICLLYFFPSNERVLKSKQEVVYEKDKNINVFLIDKYNYVSMVNVNIREKEGIKEAIELLIEKDKNNLPKNFKPTIPKNTKVLDINVNKKLCTINFSNELLNVEKSKKDKMYESIIYTLTEFKNINKVKILVEGKELKDKNYNKVLDRTIGINKIYDIDTINNMTSTTVYYLNDNYDLLYYTPVTKIDNDGREKVEIIIEELKSSLIYQSNLSSYLSSNAELKKYEIEEDVIKLTFNDKIFDDFDSKNILEEVKYTLGKSIKDNYDVEEVVFYVNNEKITKTVLKTLEN